jgi:hypothetical protein
MFRFVIAAALLPLLATALAHAGEPTPSASPATTPIGGTYRLKSETDGKTLPVGCLNHRALMFVVAEHNGSDPGAAKLVAERDCRPVQKDTDYLRCASGGYAFPADGSRVVYSSYCPLGKKELQMYVLDSLMEEVK